MKKIYVLDTNVFLTNSKSIFEYQNNDIIIPLKVLDEIDKHKKRQDGVGLNARSIIRILDNLRSKGNLHKGVRISRGKGILTSCACFLLFSQNAYNGQLPSCLPYIEHKSASSAAEHLKHGLVKLE